MKQIAFISLLLFLVAAGCSTSRGEFTRQNYEALYYSQPQSDVQEILGKPSHVENGCWVYEHTKPFYKAKVYFDPDQQVVKREWWDDPSGPTTAPTSKPSGFDTNGPIKPKIHKPKHKKHKDDNVNVGPQSP